MSGHVETVTVSRCGDWFYGDEHEHPGCPGNERGCSRCHEKDPIRRWLKRYESDLLNIYGSDGEIPPDVEREWSEKPHPTELSHAEFIRQYGRCPDACEVAEQLEIADPADVRQGGER